MTRFSYVAAIGVTLFLSFQACNSATISKADDRVMFCYFGSWADYRPSIANFDVPSIDPQLCSHVIYIYTGLKNGVIASLDEYNDYTDNYGKGTMSKFVTYADHNGFTPILGIGGWNEGSFKYSQMASTAEGRETFADSVVTFLGKFGFQGLQLDWEYPTMYGGSPTDKENYVLLLQTLYQKLQANDLLLTVGVGGAPQIANAYEFADIAKTVDYVLIITFDYHSASSDRNTAIASPLKADDGLSIEDTIKQWLAGGAPANKLVVGIPLYARTFTLSDPSKHGLGDAIISGGTPGQYSQEAGLLTYYEMCMDSKWTVVTDYSVPYVYAYHDNQWVNYDDPTTVAAKAQYVVDTGLAGMMAFSLESEDFRGECGDRNSLLTSANKVLGRL